MKIQSELKIRSLVILTITLFLPACAQSNEKILDQEIRKLLAEKPFSEAKLKREMKTHGWLRSFEGLVTAVENSDPPPPKEQIAHAYLVMKNYQSDLKLEELTAEKQKVLDRLGKRIQKAIEEERN